MIIVKKLILSIFLIFVILFVNKSCADEGVQVSDDPQSKGADAGGEGKQASPKEQETVSDDTDHRATGQEDKGGEISKLDNSEPPTSSNVDEKSQIPKAEGCDQHAPEVVEPKQQGEKSERGDQPSREPEEKKEETKLENADTPLAAVDSKKQNSKEDENTHKINLNDVNVYTANEGHMNLKRETRYSDFLSLPRDASYFFDDLEPFINNNSDNRVSRAASKDTKNQKSKVASKGKESIDTDLDDDDEDSGDDEEEEKSNEDDYDDDDDMDSDCQLTKNECTTVPECTTPTTCPPPTTTCPPPTTTCSPPTTTCPPPTTNKCTTELQCPTTCKTTRCPPLCVKANRKKTGQHITTEPTINWDADKKRLNEKKRRNRSKSNSSN